AKFLFGVLRMEQQIRCQPARFPATNLRRTSRSFHTLRQSFESLPSPGSVSIHLQKAPEGGSEEGTGPVLAESSARRSATHPVIRVATRPFKELLGFRKFRAQGR